MINAREIVRRLDAERFHVTMFVQDRTEPGISSRPHTRLLHLPRRLKTPVILREFLFGPQDILFYLKASPASRWYLNLRALRADRCALVATIESQSDWRDETIPPRVRRLFEQTILRSDHLFSNSPLVKRSLQSNYGLTSEIVRTGVDTEFFTPNYDRPPNPRPRVLFVGALRIFKGPHLVLAAAQLFPQADFMLVGDGVLRQELQERSRSLGNVAISGALGRNALRQQFAQADIFLFPSHWEGSPRVLMEAAACGLPVIARKDYEPETVVDGVTGFLVGSDDEMMTRLGQLLADSHLQRRMGKCGREHMAAFSWDLITRQWETIFARLARKQ
jgi:glycosyltransferase involved in cell wall biosynthesis